MTQRLVSREVMSMNCGRAPPRKRYGKAPYWTRLTTAVLRELLIGVHSTPETRNTTTRGKLLRRAGLGKNFVELIKGGGEPCRGRQSDDFVSRQAQVLGDQTKELGQSIIQGAKRQGPRCGRRRNHREGSPREGFGRADVNSRYGAGRACSHSSGGLSRPRHRPRRLAFAAPSA